MCVLSLGYIEIIGAAIVWYIQGENSSFSSVPTSNALEQLLIIFNTAAGYAIVETKYSKLEISNISNIRV